MKQPMPLTKLENAVKEAPLGSIREDSVLYLRV